MVSAHPFFASAQRSAIASLIDVRLKLLIALALLLSISLTLDHIAFGIITATLIGAIVALKIRLRDLRKLALPTLLMCAITLLLHLLFSPTKGNILLNLFGWYLTSGALFLGLSYCWRITLFMLAALALARLVSTDDLAYGLELLFAPLHYLRVPVAEVVMALIVAVRFIPALFDHHHQILLAQRARGATFGGGLITRIRRLVPILVPIAVRALRQSGITADALTVRCWGVSERRTNLTEARFRGADYFLLAALMAWCAAIVLAAL